MLKQLYIRNYALFEQTQVEFPHGLNILTGETGAGKSMLIGALGLINGKRADNSVIFHHEDKCIVEARFADLSINLKKRLGGYEDFDIEEEELIIRREIRPNGKSRAFINDTPVSLQILKEVSSALIENGFNRFRVNNASSIESHFYCFFIRKIVNFSCIVL